ncbi:response regulator transcription factor [Lachnoclostridium sp. An138]|uniref:response regulator transcription factor n=1 Tax=Lachnoclostridium sp. An138 TaxID=1965560 RepID=UPI000B381FC4|nr:response regulator transcription factor [Lachnoclostridium sp. An138]OUQ18262.1 DNA-binding response regulator [Lachnoclostridium sp. An138]
MAKKVILTIDDEEHILDLLEYNLEKGGYEVLRAETGEKGLAIMKTMQVDLVLLDYMLPGIDGIEVLKTMRSDPALTAMPVIMLTAKGEEIDKVLGLEMGADDYLSKPFGIRELLARVKALLRRSSLEKIESQPEDKILVGDLMINNTAREVTVDGNPITLSLKEFELLYLLASHRNRVFTREQLLELIWGYEYSGETRTVDVHVRNLRKKIEKDPDHPQYIQTVRGMGYKFV